MAQPVPEVKVTREETARHDSVSSTTSYGSGSGEYDELNVGPQFRRGRLYSTDPSIMELGVPQMEAQLANTRLEHLSLLTIGSHPNVVRNTGIICTIGPACSSVETLLKLIENGMCIARMNFSHGTHEGHAQTIANVREAVSRIPGKSVAIALDTKGPEIRTGLLKGGGSAEIHLKVGNVIKLSIDEKYRECGDQNIIFVDYKNIVRLLAVGDIIYIDDGLISLRVTDKTPTHLTTVVQNGGLLGSRKGVNLPGKSVDLPALSEKDKVSKQLIRPWFFSLNYSSTCVTQIFCFEIFPVSHNPILMVYFVPFPYCRLT